MIAKLNVENEFLSKAKIYLEKNIDCMKVEIDELTKKNTNLQNSFSRFYIGQQKLDRMLETQRAFFDKDGLGYDGSVKVYKKKWLLNWILKMNCCIRLKMI